jgi:hypothetical protein
MLPADAALAPDEAGTCVPSVPRLFRAGDNNINATGKREEIPMNHRTRLKTITSSFFIILSLFCFGVLPNSRAVNPPPDGGYPGGNTAEGQSALLSLSGGLYNTGVGIFSLLSLTEGNFNTGVGAGTLLANTADENTATGAGALLSNITGENNTATGTFALFGNTEGGDNTAVGRQALFSNINTSGNTAIGNSALFHNTSADNTAVGRTALFNNTGGNNNTAIGTGALGNSMTGSGNTALGFGAGAGVTTASNVICIGANVFGADVDNTCFIGNIFGATSSGGIAVFINSDGRLGTTTSSKRFKENIKPMDKASESLFSLKPVTFRYKKDIDPAGTSQLGLVAEEVEQVNPDLVVRDKEGKAYSVRYDQVNAMLLNEFLKEHNAFLEERGKVEKLEATVSRQQKQIEALAAGLEKVSNQIELSKAGARTIADN